MQFSTLFAFAAAASMVAALPKAPKTTTNNTTKNSQCSVGEPQCCNSMLKGHDASSLAALLGIGTVVGDIGLQCNHIPVIAGDVDNSCKTTPVCCDNTAQDGLVHVSCSPISIN